MEYAAYFGSGINLIFNLILNLGCLIFCIKKLIRKIQLHNAWQKGQLLHPLYKDEQYLSQQKELYNLKTHIVKYALVIVSLSLDVGWLGWVGALVITKGRKIKLEPRQDELGNSSFLYQHPYCGMNYQLQVLYSNPFFILRNFGFVFAYSQFVLLSILTRYLAARYLNHSFKKTLIKYIIWLTVQLFIVALCSTLYTLILSFLIFPFLAVINWLVLLRDNIILSRVLKSNLRELQFHSSNKALYREQLEAYKFYQTFKIILLLLFFLLVTVIFLSSLEDIIRSIDEICIMDLIYGLNYHLGTRISQSFATAQYYVGIGSSIICFIYSFSINLPAVTVIATYFIRICVAKYKSRYIAYRYNYDTLQPLLQGRR